MEGLESRQGRLQGGRVVETIVGRWLKRKREIVGVATRATQIWEFIYMNEWLEKCC